MTTRALPFRHRLRTPIQLAVLALLTGAVQAQTASTQEITITATKRSTSLQRTPVAVTAINAAALDDAGVQTVADVVNLVPSFSGTTQGDHGVITMTLRGIGNDSAKTEYADPEVALFVNGIYAPRPEGAAALLFDMDSIEVLRGPQGTLWGRNSTVGAVNMQTARPVLNERSTTFEGGLGAYNRMGARGAFNLPLSDNAALRLAFVHEQHDGYVDYQTPKLPSLASQQTAYAASNSGSLAGFQPLNANLFVQGGPKYNSQNQTAARVSLLWKPSKELSWDVSYEKFLDRGTPNMNLMQVPRPGEKFWSALISVAPYLQRDTDTVRSRVDYRLSDSLNLAYVAGYSRFNGASDFDQKGGIQVPTSFATGATFQEDRTNHSRYTNQSHEVSLQSAGQREVDWILGLYYAAEDNSIRFDIPIMNGTQQGTVAWQGSFIQPKETVDSKAVFGQATWNVNDALHLTGGLRYTSDDRKNIGGRNWSWRYDATVAQVPISPGADPADPSVGFGQSPQKNDGHYTNSKSTWLARAAYDVSKDAMVYGSVSTGYKSGGLQDGGVPYGPETLTNYEVGTKLSFMGGKVRWNSALYYEDFKGFQFSSAVTNPDGTHTLRTDNASGAKVSGLETELAAKLTDDDRVQLTVAFTKTKLGHLIGGSNDYALPPCSVPGIGTCLDVTGNALPHAPRISAQFQVQHTVHLADGATLTPRASVHYESSSWLSVFNLGDGDQQKAYGRGDVGLRYASGKGWWADAFVRNIADGKVKTNAGLDGSGIWTSQYLPPRTWGLNAGVEF